MDFRHLIVTCLFSMLRLSFEAQKIKENYAILIRKTRLCYIIFFNYFPRKLFPNVYHIFLYNKFP